MKTNEYLQPLWDAFERYADLSAVVDHGGRVTTYRQLGELTRRIAGGLASLDLPENSFIPILLPTSMEYIAAEMGVWMAGHAVVPMGITFPEGRIEYIKEHCEAPLVIDEQKYLSRRRKCDPDDSAPGDFHLFHLHESFLLRALI